MIKFFSVISRFRSMTEKKPGVAGLFSTGETEMQTKNASLPT